MIFFFKQKTAYEMRISDWSSDVCSSDLRQRRARRLDLPLRPTLDRRSAGRAEGGGTAGANGLRERPVTYHLSFPRKRESSTADPLHWRCRTGPAANGRASCRGRVCQYVKI